MEEKDKKEVRRKAGRKARRKGSSFELNCCKLLTAWWFPDDDFTGVNATKLPFFRSPGSGGWATKRKHQNDNRINEMSGDIICPSDFPFSIEMKNQEEWDFDQYFKENPGFKLWGWWKQTTEQAERANKKPLLLFTKNHSPVYYAMYEPNIIANFNLRTTLLWTPDWYKTIKFYVGLLSNFAGKVSKVELLKLYETAS